MASNPSADIELTTSTGEVKCTTKPFDAIDAREIGATSKEHEVAQSYLHGIRLYLITASLCLCLFLTNLEIPIVTTALVGITKDLGGFDKLSWIISSYLLGYVGKYFGRKPSCVLVVFAKFSDIFGRKTCLHIAIFFFVVFSGACGAAQTIDQLIIFRAFQGIGGAGNYAVSTIIIIELVPSDKYAKYTSFIAFVYCLSLLLGPIFGGAISQSTSWRWIFLLNVPAGILGGVILLFSMPNGFPHHGKPYGERPNSGNMLSMQKFQRIDGIGTILLLISTLFLVAALEEAGIEFPWKSAFVIALLVISGLSVMCFALWERKITTMDTHQEPIFPWRFAKSRVLMGMLLNALFLGAPWFCAMFQLPQRLQIVNVETPLYAGVRFIPFTLAAPVGSSLSAAVAKKAKVPALYLVIFAATLQIVGFALLSTLPESQSITARQYGYEWIAGFGCGINISLLVVMVPFAVQERDKSVAMGLIPQFRVMGGVIGLAIISAAFNGLVRSQLRDDLSQEQLDLLLQTPANLVSFPENIQAVVRSGFAKGYNLQMKILCGLAAGQIPASLLMWQKDQIKI